VCVCVCVCMYVCMYVCVRACVCGALVNPLCAALYRHPWPVWLYHIFPHYLINNTIFGKK